MLFPFLSHAFPFLYFHPTLVLSKPRWRGSSARGTTAWVEGSLSLEKHRVEQNQKINLSCFWILLICSTPFYTPLPHVSSWEWSAKGIILDATNFGGCQATATIVRYCLCIITCYEHIKDFVILKQGARLIHLGTFSEGALLWHLCNIISPVFNFGTSSLAPHSSSSLRLVPFTHRHAANARLIPTAWFWIHLHEYYQKLACTWLYHGDLRLYKRNTP